VAANLYKTYSTAPDAFVVFYPYKQEDTRKQDSLLKDPFDTSPLLVQDEIIQISTSKPKTGTGTFSILLSPAQRFKSKLHPGCWCVIYMSNRQLSGKETSAEDSGLRMMGIVRSIRMIEDTDSATGIRTTRYQVSGDDFQSIFNNTIFISDILRSALPNKKNSDVDALKLFDLKALRDTKPDTVMGWLISGLLGKSSSFESAFNSGPKLGGVFGFPSKLFSRLYGKKAVNDHKVASAINFVFQRNLLGQISVATDFGSNINIWSLLKTYSNPILNEIYTDICPVSVDGAIHLLPTFVYRSIPFSTKNKEVDPSTYSIAGNAKDRREDPSKVVKETGIQLFLSKDIPDEEIISLNHGKSDVERFNFFLVSPNANTDQLAAYTFHEETSKKVAGSDPIADINSLVRYGLRQYIVNAGTLILNQDIVIKCNQIVRDMWYPAHLFESGQVTIIGSEKPIPVGTNIRFTNRGWIAHVEAVQNVFSVGGDGRKRFYQTISFVRLQKTTGKPIDSVEKQSEPLAWEPGRSSSRGVKK
jgi:hypothetical protein